VDSGIFDVDSWERKEFSISGNIINKKDGFKCRIITVYGDADESRKHDFLDELESFSMCTTTPCIFGGDFKVMVGWTLDGVKKLILGLILLVCWKLNC
jgi:hypothetical protein